MKATDTVRAVRRSVRAVKSALREPSYRFYDSEDRGQLQKLLRSHGFYSTEGRLFLLSLLKKSAQPLSAPLIVKKMAPYLDEVNVYRALDDLSRKYVISRPDLRQNVAHYEFADRHHHHVVCSQCGSTEDIDQCIVGALQSKAVSRTRTFARIDTHTLEFFGTCKPCAKSHATD